MEGAIKGIYRPRHPERTPRYAIFAENLEHFLDTYDDRHLDRDGTLPVEAIRALRGYTECGILHYGFARLHCDDCGEDRLLPFSCQRRGFCPSCTQKRVEQFVDFVPPPSTDIESRPTRLWHSS